MFSKIGGLQKTHSYCQLFEKVLFVQDLQLTLNTKENLPSFKQKKVKTIARTPKAELQLVYEVCLIAITWNYETHVNTYFLWVVIVASVNSIQ